MSRPSTKSAKGDTRSPNAKSGNGRKVPPSPPSVPPPPPDDETSLSYEARTRYLNYALSVITSRALPDVRDGLKPVHRRILYTMNENGFTPDSAHKKSARVTGDTMGKYHPHGNLAIYDALVRLAQTFSMRLPLLDGQGNFGSIDGDTTES